MKTTLLLTPGPTKVPDDLCAALGRPIIHHRTPQFQEYLKEAVSGLKDIFQTKNDVYLIASSGTGAMEAAVSSFLSPGDKAITVEGGKFGERWTELCKAFKVEAEPLAVEWGKSVDPAEIGKRLKEDPSIKAVFITLCETSTGVTSDVKAIGEVVKKSSAILVVDAVSGLAVTDLQTDHWSVDVAVAASHKGLMLPPGLAFLAVSRKAQAMMESSTSPRYYFDLRKYKKAADKTDTPFTPAIGIVIALVESIKRIKKEGLQNLLKKCERLAQMTRKAAKDLGLTLLADDSCISNVLTAINVPEGIDGGKLVKTMRDVHGISVAGGQGHLKGKLVRIAHMGCLEEADIRKGIDCMATVLKEMGYSPHENSRQ